MSPDNYEDHSILGSSGNSVVPPGSLEQHGSGVPLQRALPKGMQWSDALPALLQAPGFCDHRRGSAILGDRLCFHIYIYVYVCAHIYVYLFIYRDLYNHPEVDRILIM